MILDFTKKRLFPTVVVPTKFFNFDTGTPVLVVDKYDPNLLVSAFSLSSLQTAGVDPKTMVVKTGSTSRLASEMSLLEYEESLNNVQLNNNSPNETSSTL